MIGDFLYQLTPRDEQVTPLQFYADHRNFSANSVGLQHSFTVPPGLNVLWRPTFWGVRAVAGAAQNVTLLAISAGGPTYPNSLDLLHSGVIAVSERSDYRDNPSPTWFDSRQINGITFLATFSGSAAANSLGVTLMILMIPIGNASPGSMLHLAL